MIAALASALILAAPTQIDRIPIRPSDDQRFPERVSIKTSRQSFNRRHYALLREGRIFFKANEEETGLREDWQLLPVPDYVAGKVVELAVDDTYVIAITEDRRIHTMTGFLEVPRRFAWVPESRWGAPFWGGKGMDLPQGTISWDISYNSVPEDKYYVDPAGNRQSIGSGCTSLYALDLTGQNLTLIDPWLPADLSYRVCGPRRNRFVARSLSSSGSVIALINRHGDIYVRRYDFDMAGGDWFFFAATYEDMGSPKAKARFHPVDLWKIPRAFAGRYNEVSKFPRQLPLPDWARQEKISGEITDRITVTKEGPGGAIRHLRVEGIQQDRTGYFHTLARFSETDANGRPIPQQWEFVPTDEPLQGQPIENLPGDTTDRTLAPTAELTFSRDADSVGKRARHPFGVVVSSFDPYCSPAEARIDFENGEKLALVLHTRETIRQQPRAAGLDDEPMELQGAVELPQEIDRERLGEAGRWFVERVFRKNKRFASVKVVATKRRLEISSVAGLKLVLERD